MTTDPARPPGAPWPGSGAEMVGAPVTIDAFALDGELRARVERAVEERPASVDADPWRQTFHIQPPVGLLNDPNGLVQHRGTYHLCYQWHPFAPKHALKFWAHLTSTDLVHWTEQPVALAPSHDYESHGCYSGSGIVHEGAVRFLYTGNVRTPEGGRTPFQLLATVDPSGRVIKHRANPLVGAIPGCTAHVRDPKVWRRDGSSWMVLGAQTEELHGTALLLRSDDLVDWEYLGQLAGGAGDPYGYMWECPDLVRIDDRDVLVISPQLDHGEPAGAGRWEDISVYAVGTLDVSTPAFAREGDYRRVDAGPDFYAPQTLTDESGRTIMVAWMGMPDHEGQPSLAQKHPTVANGWVHCLTVPRVLSLEGDTLLQWPVAQLEALRGEPIVMTEQRVDADTSVAPHGATGTALDLALSATCDPGGSIGVRLRDGDAGRPVVLTLDPHAGIATLDRTLLGSGEGGVHTGTFRPGHRVEARILLDHSSIEVFVDGGRLAMSARIYPVAGDDLLCIDVHGAPATLDVTVWPMTPA
ncbi:MAG: glycoside hydrolase family 32 protein [Candidatus Nanopelagicales bacterium]|nr:glycoside hydrolase family 32 protein [Candidatus Nanopelagicales bacterium]